jgi:hypothetical protein
LERLARALTVALCASLACRSDHGPGTLPIPGENGPRVTLEVLNASPNPGRARVGTRLLRRAGFDVVSFGNAEGQTSLDSTRIVVRRGGAAVGRRVREALGLGRVAVQLDSTKLLDVSVFLGADFSPRLRFHP